MRYAGKALMVGMALAAAGCNKSDPVDPTVPAKMLLVDGQPQTGASGSAAAAPLRVRVQNAAGDPVAGVVVTWTVTSGGGTVSNPAQPTGADGNSSVTFTYGIAGPQVITASIPGLSDSPQTFTLTATGGGGGGGGGGA